MQEQTTSERSEQLLFVFPNCQSKVTMCHLGKPLAKSPDDVHSNHRDFSHWGLLEEEFAWGKGAARNQPQRSTREGSMLDMTTVLFLILNQTL